MTQEQFIKALSGAVDKQLEDREKLSSEIDKQYNGTNQLTEKLNNTTDQPALMNGVH